MNSYLRPESDPASGKRHPIRTQIREPLGRFCISAFGAGASEYNESRMNRRRMIELLSAPLMTQLSLTAARPGHVVIAGAGIVGASIACHLAKRGAQVTVLEKQQPGSGATRNSFAWLNASFSKQPRSYYELNLAGMAGWRRLSLEFRDLQVQWGGSVQWYEPGDRAERLRRNVACRSFTRSACWT